MSCVAFPTKKQCSGIGLGGCVSKFNYFSLQVMHRSVSKIDVWVNYTMANLCIHTFMIYIIAKVAALAMLFSPRVVYFIVITIIFCIAGGIGIAVYVFKRYINVKIILISHNVN